MHRALLPSAVSEHFAPHFSSLLLLTAAMSFSKLSTDLQKHVCKFLSFEDFEATFASSPVLREVGQDDKLWSAEAARVCGNKQKLPKLPMKKEQAKQLLDTYFFICLDCKELIDEDGEAEGRQHGVCSLHGEDFGPFCDGCHLSVFEGSEFCKLCKSGAEPTVLSFSGSDEEEEEGEPQPKRLKVQP
jgi:hypothetical protein